MPEATARPPSSLLRVRPLRRAGAGRLAASNLSRQSQCCSRCSSSTTLANRGCSNSTGTRCAQLAAKTPLFFGSLPIDLFCACVLSCSQPEQKQQQIVRELFSTLTVRSEASSSFVDASAWFGVPGARIIYRQYATLYFCIAIDSSESELGILDLIQVLVETLDRHFKNVCELDIIFNSERVHFVVDEMIVGVRARPSHVPQTPRMSLRAYASFLRRLTFPSKTVRVPGLGCGDQSVRDPRGYRRAGEIGAIAERSRRGRGRGAESPRRACRLAGRSAKPRVQHVRIRVITAKIRVARAGQIIGGHSQPRRGREVPLHPGPGRERGARCAPRHATRRQATERKRRPGVSEARCAAGRRLDADRPTTGPRRELRSLLLPAWLPGALRGRARAHLDTRTDRHYATLSRAVRRPAASLDSLSF